MAVQRSSGSFYVDGWAARVHDDMNLVVLAVMSVVAAWSMYRRVGIVRVLIVQDALGGLRWRRR